MTPHGGNIFSSIPSSPLSLSWTLEGHSELCLSRALNSPSVLPLERQRNKDTVRFAESGVKVTGHRQKQPTHTLIVRLLKTHLFTRILKWILLSKWPDLLPSQGPQGQNQEPVARGSFQNERFPRRFLLLELPESTEGIQPGALLTLARNAWAHVRWWPPGRLANPFCRFTFLGNFTPQGGQIDYCNTSPRIRIVWDFIIKRNVLWNVLPKLSSLYRLTLFVLLTASKQLQNGPESIWLSFNLLSIASNYKMVPNPLGCPSLESRILNKSKHDGVSDLSWNYVCQIRYMMNECTYHGIHNSFFDQINHDRYVRKEWEGWVNCRSGLWLNLFQFVVFFTKYKLCTLKITVLPGGAITPLSVKHPSSFLLATPSYPSRTLEGLFELTWRTSRTLNLPCALLL